MTKVISLRNLVDDKKILLFPKKYNSRLNNRDWSCQCRSGHSFLSQIRRSSADVMEMY